MFIGHFAIGFAAKKFAPRASLAPLLAAPLLSDMLWPVFLLLGWEHARVAPGDTKFSPLDLYDFPWSHSLLMTLLWVILFAGAYFLITRYKPGAIAIALGVISHWLLDWITHRPDMPLYPGASPKFGLALWNSIPGTMAVEITMFVIGIVLYVQTTRARDAIGKYAFAVFVLLLFAIYVADPFQPAPDSIAEVAWTGIALIVIVLPWSAWFDRHRVLRHEATP
ncbi:MAG: metal-dependent hydrolase [Acidobacteria bacterium]|nr:metal-dependent hydrolase [Acidobacteriota bacterium]